MKNYWLERIDKKNNIVDLQKLQRAASDYAVFGTSEKELNFCLERIGLEIVKRYAPRSLQNATTVAQLVYFCKLNIKKRGQAFGKHWGVIAFNYCTTLMMGYLKQLKVKP